MIPDDLKVSIIIPTYNRPDSLSMCLSSLEEQIVAPYELIVVVDGSATDEVQKVIDSFKCNNKFVLVQITNNERKGHSTSLNIGAKHARGDIIAYLDDDVTLVPDWVYQIVKGYKDNKNAAGVGGRVIDVVPFMTGRLYNFMHTMRSFLFRKKMGKVNFVGMPYLLDAHSDEYIQVDYLCGGNMSVRREILASHGFDEVMRRATDLDFCVRLSKNEKKKLVYNSRAIAYHHRDPVGGCETRGSDRMYWAFRNHIYYLLKDFNFKYIRVVLYSIIIIIYSFLTLKIIYLKAIPDGAKQYRKSFIRLPIKKLPTNKDRQSIGVLTAPAASKAGSIPLSNLIDILCPLFGNIYVITGNEGDVLLKKNDESIHVFNIQQKVGANVFTKIANYIYAQLRISYKLLKLTRDVDSWIFFMGAELLLLPMLTAKLLRKHVVMALPGSALKTAQAQKDPFSKVIALMGKINYTLSNRITLCSKNLIKDWNLEKYENKISIAHEHFLDFNEFKTKKKFDERNNLVGYVGRLSEEKGTLNFVKAILLILKQRDDLKFLIGGDGQLRDNIEKYLEKENLDDKVKLAGWIPHGELPDYLNKLKLLAIPSYTESGPLIALEAISCGTPILATSVGHIPNIVKDGETGFILENNTSECIAENVIRALQHPELEKIVKNARELVEKEFTYESAVERYRKILEEIYD